MTYTPSTTEQSTDDIDIANIIKALWHGKLLIIFITFIFTAIGITYVIMATPIYSANALIQIENKSSGIGGLSDISSVLGGGAGGGETATEIEIMRSRDVLEPTVDRYNLTIAATPYKAPIIGEYFYRKFSKSVDNEFGKPLLAKFFEISNDYAWGGEKIVVNLFELPDEYSSAKIFIKNLGNDKFELILDNSVILNGTIGIVHTISDFNIKIKVGFLKGRVGTYYSLIKRNKTKVIEELSAKFLVSERSKNSGIIRISMESQNQSLAVKIINDILGTYQQKNIALSNVTAGNSINFIEERIPKTAERLKNAEALIYEYRLNNKTVDLSLQTQHLLDQSLKLEGGLNELLLQEPELSRKYENVHPIYTEFLRKKADIEQKLLNVNIQTAQIPTEQFNIYKLQREVELSQKLHIQTLNKYEELKIIRAGTLGSVRVIDSAIVYPDPVTPQKAVIVLSSFFAGFVISMFIVLVKSMFNRKLSDGEQFSDSEQFKLLGSDILASLPISKMQAKLSKMPPKKGELRVLSDSNPEDPAVEALRSLRTDVHFSMLEAKNNIIMIAGPGPKVGKSFTALNLATLLAQAENNVLLVDIDMRRGALHHQFGQSKAPGLADYLNAKEDFSAICHKSKIEGLDVVMCGAKPVNPSELLIGKRFAEFCELVKPKYNIVIFDTPPLLAVTDAMTVGRMAGKSIMVVDQHKSQIKEIELAHNKLLSAGVKVDGYVVNGLEKSAFEQIYQYNYN